MQQYTVQGGTYDYRIEGLDESTEYNVSVQARTAAGYQAARSTVMRTEELSELCDASSLALFSSVRWNHPRQCGSIVVRETKKALQILYICT